MHSLELVKNVLEHEPIFFRQYFTDFLATENTEGMKSTPEAIQLAIEFLRHGEDSSVTAGIYPPLLRVAKRSVLEHPETYRESRNSIQNLLTDSSRIKDLGPRISKQARAIDLLLEITDKDLRGFGENLTPEVEQQLLNNLSKFVQLPPQSSNSRIFGIKAPVLKGMTLQDCIKKGLSKHLLSSRDYQQNGFNAGYVQGLYYLDLALEASGITGALPNERVFSQAILDVTAPYSDSSIDTLRNTVERFIAKNFSQGLITPPPIANSIKEVIRDNYPDERFESSDSGYYAELIAKIWTERRSELRKKIVSNPVWTRSFMPDKYLRYKEVFDSLKDLFGDSVTSALEMGCSTFGAALALLRYFPTAKVVGCDLVEENNIRTRVSEEVLAKMDAGQVAYRQWDISMGVFYSLNTFNEYREGEGYDVVMLLNSAYPHLRSTTHNPFHGRVAAIGAALKIARKAVVVAGGEGLHNAYSASDPLQNKATDQGNGWIFVKNSDGGIEVKGITYK